MSLSLILETEVRLTTRFRLLFDDPRLRPPVLTEMMPDLERVMLSVARSYVDDSCMDLHLEELLSYGRAKLGVLVSKGYLEKTGTRSKFFGLFHRSYKNLVYSLVQKNRGTHKRTGLSSEERRIAGTKNIERSLDSEETPLQVADERDARHTETQEVEEEYRSLLTPLERLVYDQLIQPNLDACLRAELDSSVGRRTARPVEIRIREKHLAQGLGFREGDERHAEFYREIVAMVQAKVREFRTMTEQERADTSRRQAALLTLCNLFGLQIPPITDQSIVRRMLTIAARIQHSKVNAQVAELLLMCGALVPKMQGGVMACFGVLFQDNKRECNGCDYRVNCRTVAANYGLDKITLDAKLMGAKGVRTPVVAVGNVSSGTDAEMEAIQYCKDHLMQVRHRGQVYFHASGNKTFLFGLRTGQVNRLTFCNPVPVLQKRLICVNRRWECAPGYSGSQIIQLINQHLKHSL